MDFYTKSEIDEKFGVTISSPSWRDLYTKTEIDANVGTPETLVLPSNMMDFYTKTEIDSISTGDYRFVSAMDIVGGGFETLLNAKPNTKIIIDSIPVTNQVSGVTTCLFHAFSNWVRPYSEWVFVSSYYDAEYGTFMQRCTGVTSPRFSQDAFTRRCVVTAQIDSVTVEYADGQTLTASIPDQGTVPDNGPEIFIFAYSGARAWNEIINSTGRFYSCKIYEGEILVADFVPAIRRSDNKACIYDKVRNEPFFWPGNTMFPVE